MPFRADRRRRPRLRLSYPLRLFRPGDDAPIHTTTEDVSCEGFYCITQFKSSPLDILECELEIPSKDSGLSTGDRIILHCQVRVVRVVPRTADSTFGLACQLADYTIGHQICEEETPELLAQGA